jgi:pentatricopeptide repeat protein
MIYGLVSTKAGGGSAEVPVPPAEDLLGENLRGEAVSYSRLHPFEGDNEYRSGGRKQWRGPDEAEMIELCGEDEKSGTRPGAEMGTSRKASDSLEGSEREGLSSTLDRGDNTVENDHVRTRRQSSGVDLALALLCEMHLNGLARTSRHAAYVYNTLIAAAARQGDLDIAAQIFIKMCRHNNPRVVYLHDEIADAGMRTPAAEPEHRRLPIHRRDIVGLGIWSSGLSFPVATTGTYNSMIHAARSCDRPDIAFRVFVAMERDRLNEAGQATLSLLADVSLESADVAGLSTLQLLLRKLDEIPILAPELKIKRGSLRKVVVSLRWAERASTS